MLLTDRFGRTIDYLRISVTSRCNLNCLYCRPLGHAYSVLPGEQLSLEEIVTVAQAAASLGVKHIRLTGGEPLLRDDLPALVCRLNEMPQITDLAVTTNGQLLAQRAGERGRAFVHQDVDPDQDRGL